MLDSVWLYGSFDLWFWWIRFLLHIIKHCLDQSLSNNCKSSHAAIDLLQLFFSILTKSFWNQYLWFCPDSFNHYVKLQLIFIRKKPACDRRASLSKGGVYHRSLALSLISNFDPCSLSSLYPPCVKGTVRTFSLMRTVLRGDTKSYKINTSKPLLSKLWLW